MDEKDYLSQYIEKEQLPKDEDDFVLNLLLKFLLKTDKNLSDNARKSYETLQLMINGKGKKFDEESVELIREAYNELMEEMRSSEIDVESIKKLMSQEDCKQES